MSMDLDRALAEASRAVHEPSFGDPHESDLLRDLVEAVEHRRNSTRHHAERILRARDGDDECRDTSVEDAVALAEGVLVEPGPAAPDGMAFDYMVCVGGACERRADASMDEAPALARARELALGDDQPVQVVIDCAPVAVVGERRSAPEEPEGRRP